MNINFDKLNKLRDEMEARKASKNKGPFVSYWRPKAGKNEIRILPPWTDEGEFEGQFWYTVGQHWKVSTEAKYPILCVENTEGYTDESCPVCEAVKDLYRIADGASSPKEKIQAIETAKKIKVKSAWFMNIIDVNDPTYTAEDVAKAKERRPDVEPDFEVGDYKVQIYASGPMVFNDIRDNMINNEIDATNLDVGHNWIIQKTGTGFDTRYNLTMKVKPTCIEGFDTSSLINLPEAVRVTEPEKIRSLLGESVTKLFGAPSESAPVAAFGAGDDEDDLPESFGGSAKPSEDLEDELRNALAG